jgi:hypothetical protein
MFPGLRRSTALRVKKLNLLNFLCDVYCISAWGVLQPALSMPLNSKIHFASDQWFQYVFNVTSKAAELCNIVHWMAFVCVIILVLCFELLYTGSLFRNQNLNTIVLSAVLCDMLYIMTVWHFMELDRTSWALIQIVFIFSSGLEAWD